MMCSNTEIIWTVLVGVTLALGGCDAVEESVFTNESVGPLTDLPEVNVSPVDSDDGGGDDGGDGVLSECGECPMGSGYPCACEVGTICQDGSSCMPVDPGVDIGICSPLCDAKEDCSFSSECFAEGSCVSVGLFDACVLLCAEDEDCPTNMICNEWLCVDEDFEPSDTEGLGTDGGDADTEEFDSDS